jgi:hypothetical protein
VGANLLRALELSSTPWAELHRSNQDGPHPALFAVYGDVLYHHGAAFRDHGVILRSDRDAAPANVPVPPLPGLGPVVRRINRSRLRRWRHETEAANAELSEAMFQRIASDDPGWLASVLGPGKTQGTS